MSTGTTLSALKEQNAAIQQDQQVNFFSRQGFDLACRIAKAYTQSDAVPAQFRAFNLKKDRAGNESWIQNDSALGNALVAVEVAQSVGMSIAAVMQNADVIEGKLRWSSKFQIAAVNASGRFSPLRFKLTNGGRVTGKYKEKTDWNKSLNRYNYVERAVETDDWECIAWAYVLDARGNPTQEIVQSIPVSMKMAIEEGWYARNGSKWQGAMRFQMLQYRAGTFFASIYAPDVIMGMGKATEEIHDMGDLVQGPDGAYAPTTSGIELQQLRTGNDTSDAPPEPQGGQQKQEQPAIAHQPAPDPIPSAIPHQADMIPRDTAPARQQEAAPQQQMQWTPSPEEAAEIAAREAREATASRMQGAPEGFDGRTGSTSRAGATSTSSAAPAARRRRDMELGE